MKYKLWILLFLLNVSLHAKEWKSLKAFQKHTQKQQLSSSDWLKSDRKNNTHIWQKANAFNLIENTPEEYSSLIERRDFYRWIQTEFQAKGHEVLWPEMAYLISHKLRLVRAFPYNIFTRKKIKAYTDQGSEVVFNASFVELQALMVSTEILKDKAALSWDAALLKQEQHVWVQSVYIRMDTKSLRTISRMAKGQFLYGLIIPKALRFYGDLSNPDERLDYARNTLRPYCATRV